MTFKALEYSQLWRRWSGFGDFTLRRIEKASRRAPVAWSGALTLFFGQFQRLGWDPSQKRYLPSRTRNIAVTFRLVACYNKPLATEDAIHIS